VERLYDIDAEAADCVLKDLTVYLRAAVPQTHDPTSTIAREIRLTNAFLNIVGMRSKDRLVRSDTAISIEETTTMPPMVLLPLIKHALAHRVKRAQADECFGIDVVVRNDRLRLTIRDQGSGFASEGANDMEVRHIRERLAVLYGDRARLTLKQTEGGTEAVMEIPYEVVAEPCMHDAMP
jgi:LytS/YehU family sensor histidine kinase